MNNTVYIKKFILSCLIFATLTLILSCPVLAGILYINKDTNFYKDKIFNNDIKITDNGTQAAIIDSSINGVLSIFSGAKVNLYNDSIIGCQTLSSCSAMIIQGIGYDSAEQGDSTDLVADGLTITSNRIGLSSGGSALVTLSNVNINSVGYGVSLNGSVSKNGIINTTKIDNFTILAGDEAVSAVAGALVYLSNGTILTNNNEAYGVYLGGANYNNIKPVQTTAYIENVTVHTTGEKSYGLYSEQLSTTSTGGNHGGISYWYNSHIITEGTNSAGIVANFSSNEVYLNNRSTVNTLGDNAYGIWSRGRANVYLNNSVVNTEGSESHAAMLQYAGNISLADSSIQAQGLNSDGVHVLMGGVISNNNRISSTLSLTRSDISSEQGYGISMEGGQLQVTLTDNSLLQGQAGLMNIQNYAGTSTPLWDQGITTINLRADNNSVMIGKIETADSAIANIELYNNSLWQFDENSNLTNLINDHSIIQFNSASDISHILTINGNYTGNDGTIIINGILSGDDSSIDKLIIKGDTAGHTYVKVNNLGGQGSKTIDGIEVIDITGNSAGTFEQSGRIVAGAYDYFLVRGVGIANSNNWYLSSDSANPDIDILRPETGSYLANLYAANNMFNLRLHDRQGEKTYIDFATGELKTTSMWLRYQYSDNKFVAGGQFDVKNSWTVTQLGGDISTWSFDSGGKLHLGLMVGYGRSTNDVDANLAGYRSSGKVDGYNLGAYATWYQNDIDKKGLYIDSWVMWNDLSAHVDGQDQNTEKYDLTGFNISIESGYTFLLKTTEYYNVWLQPQGQIIWMGVDADEHTESNGTRVTGHGDNLQTRLGLRAVLDSNSLNPDFNGQVFIETNWLYNSKALSITMDNERVYQSGSRNIGELKAGIESTLYKDTNIWANLSYQKGDHHYRGVGLMLGMQFQF